MDWHEGVHRYEKPRASKASGGALGYVGLLGYSGCFQKIDCLFSVSSWVRFAGENILPGWPIGSLQGGGNSGGRGLCWNADVRSWLCRAGGTGRDSDENIFVDDRWSSAGAALADAIEIGVVELAWEVVAGFSVADSEVFPAEERRRVRVGVGR